MDPSVSTVAIVAAAPVIRTALKEMRHPGGARDQWAFARNGEAMATGLLTGLLPAAVGWRAAGYEAVAWASLAGVLVAHTVDRGEDEQDAVDQGRHHRGV